MKGLLVVLLIALLGTAVVADLPNNDVEQLEEADSSTYDAAQAESINAVPTETMDPEEREKAEVYSAAAHLTNHISFGGATAHSEASPYASLFQVQEMDSRRLAEKDMALDNINIVPEENDDSHAPVIPFYASSDMTELADPLTDIESEHHVDEQEDQAMDHAADVLAEDVEASDVAELSLSAPSLVEEEELPHVHEEDDASFLETLHEDNEDAEEADDSAESDEQDDEEDDDAEEHDDATATAPHEEEDDSYTEERDDSFDDNHADADADNHTPAAADDEAADAPAPAATTEAADEDHHTVGEQEAAAPAEADDLVQAAAEAPAAAAAAADPTAPQAASDVTANVQDA